MVHPVKKQDMNRSIYDMKCSKNEMNRFIAAMRLLSW
jgi:hypothetical protein